MIYLKRFNQTVKIEILPHHIDYQALAKIPVIFQAQPLILPIYQMKKMGS